MRRPAPLHLMSRPSLRRVKARRAGVLAVRGPTTLLVALAAMLLAVPLSAGAEWRQGPELPTCRSELTAATLAGRIYVIAGLGLLGGQGTVEALDPATGSWHTPADLPVHLHHVAAAALDGRLYVSGGYTGFSFTADQRGLWAYDPTRDAWERRADLPAPRAAHVMVALGDRLYVVGGVGPRHRELWRYDPATDAWETDLAPLPTEREHLGAAALEGRLYAVGGRWDGRGNLGTLEAYDPATDRWEALPPMPTPRGGITAAAMGGRLHVTGGEAFSPGRTFAQHEAYDPATGSWQSLAPMPTARHGLASAVWRGAWHVIGGGTGAGMRTLVTLSCAVEVWGP